MPSILFCNLKPLKLYCLVLASFTTTQPLVGLEVVPRTEMGGKGAGRNL